MLLLTGSHVCALSIILSVQSAVVAQQKQQPGFIAGVNQRSSADLVERCRFMPGADPASLFSELGQIEICCFSIIYSG